MDIAIGMDVDGPLEKTLERAAALRDRGFTRMWSSQIFGPDTLTVFAVVSGLTQAPMGYLADRIGARKILLMGLTLAGCASPPRVAVNKTPADQQLLLRTARRLVGR